MNGLKQQFAERLRQAMVAAGLQPRPSVLVNMFNLEHRGDSVTFQTASRWLKGVSLPDPAKIRTLARILGLKPEALLFDHASALPDGPLPSRTQLISRQDRHLLDAFQALSADDRKLVRALLQSLAGKAAPRR